MAGQKLAALDTSFWTVGHRADVLPYLFEFFAPRVPSAVRAEILTPDRQYPRRRYGYAALFGVLEGCGMLSTAQPNEVGSRFGRGEAEALALAQEHGWLLLINDARPLAYARQSGVRTLSVPGFMFRLYAQGSISLRGVERQFASIESITTPSVLRPVQRAVIRLAHVRGELVP